MAAADAELVASARAGSQDAFRELLRRYERPVYALVVRMVHDPSLAEDLAQEVFLKAFRSLAGFDPQRKFASWLFKIAHNTTIDQLRRRAVETEPLETGGDDDRLDPLATVADPRAATPEAERQRTELGRALERAVAGLRPEYREAVLLRFQEGLAYEEIAEVLGVPLGTVKTHLHRARRELAERLRGMGWAP